MNRRFFLYGSAAAALAVAGGYFLHEWRPKVAPLDDPVAELFALSLFDLEGHAHKLADWKGQPMVINFWATWCASCVKELPQLEALQKNHPQVRFIGIGVDTADNMRAFTQKVPVSYSLLVMGTDPTETLRALGNVTAGLPFTLLLNGEGHIEKSLLGPVSFENLTQVLSRLGR